MKRGRPIFFIRWLSLFSLDALLVALAWQQVVARAAGIHLVWQERALLGIAVWIIYVSDHLLDGVASKKSSSILHQAPRHYFVDQHSCFFLIVIAIAVSIEALLLAHISRSLFIAGGLLALITGIYLFCNTLLLTHCIWPRGKEIFIALVFTIGCSLVPLSRLSQGVDPYRLFFSMILFLMLCIINATLIARLERGVARERLLSGFIPSPSWILPSAFILLLINTIINISSNYAGYWFMTTPFLASLMGLSFIPTIANDLGYEVASLATDGALVLGAVISFL